MCVCVYTSCQNAYNITLRIKVLELLNFCLRLRCTVVGVACDDLVRAGVVGVA